MGDGPGTGVWQWGPCSGVGEAGLPGGQRRSDMTAAAVVVGGLALWHGHPARAQVSSVLHAYLSSPLGLSIRAYTERERRAGGVGEAPNLPSRLADGSEWRRVAYMWAVCAAIWCMYVIRYVGRTAIGTCWCAVLDLVFVQNGERRRFGWRAARL